LSLIPGLPSLLAGVPLLLLASQAMRLDTNVCREGDWLPSQAESVRALHTLEHMDRVGIVYSLRVILELPADSIAQTDAGWNALDRLSKRMASDPRSYRVISITTIAESNRSGLGNLPRETRRTFLSRDGRAALMEILPATSVSLNDQVPGCESCGRRARPLLTGVPGATLRIGGIPALIADYQTIVSEKFTSVLALVVGGTLLALLERIPLAFRRGEGHCI
jgi:RND superfamily putative drug exporter